MHLAIAIAQSQGLGFATIWDTKTFFYRVVSLQTKTEKLQAMVEAKRDQEAEPPKVLCPHCLRTATNGIQCKGICVADSDY
jgi:hypothetical protein